MKKYAFFLCSLFTMALLLSACGKQEEQAENVREYYVLDVQEEAIDEFAVEDGLELLRTQYYKGEPVQIKAELKKDENLYNSLDLYLCRADGQKELMITGVSGAYRRYNWFMGEDDCFYLWSGEKYAKLDANGAAVYSGQFETSIRSVCLTEAGTVIFYVINAEEGSRLVPMDAAGTPEEGRAVYVSEGTSSYVTGVEDDVLLFSAQGVYEIQLEDGIRTELMSFVGQLEQLYGENNYLSLSDFRIGDNGQIDMLQNTGVRELNSVNIAEVKDLVVVCVSIPSKELKAMTAVYNKQSEDYYVVLNVPGENEELKDYYQRIVLEYSSGNGADIYSGDAGLDEVSLIEKGGYATLNTYLEESGIREQDYFPVTFDAFRDGETIYAINPFCSPQNMYISKDFLRGSEIPTIEKLLGLLDEYKGDSVFHIYYNEKHILNYFLEGTEDLWGMVNWEQGTCDFEGELFTKMLKVSKRYAYSEEKADYPTVAEINRKNGLYGFETEEQLETRGFVAVGTLSEDGAYPTFSVGDTMMINSQSQNKEGAWDYLHYLLTEGQSELLAYNGMTYFPVSRVAYAELIQQEIEEGSLVSYVKDGKPGRMFKGGYADLEALGEEMYRAKYDMTKEKGAELAEYLDTVRTNPKKTQPILSIIYEETDSYFNGNKTIEEVVSVIENRVQLYLNEHR